MNVPREPLTPKTDELNMFWYAKRTKDNVWHITRPWRSVKIFYYYWKVHGAKTIVKSKFSEIEKQFPIRGMCCRWRRAISRKSVSTSLRSSDGTVVANHLRMWRNMITFAGISNPYRGVKTYHQHICKKKSSFSISARRLRSS